MNYLNLLNYGNQILKLEKIPSYRLDSELLLAKVTNKTREEILTNLNNVIKPDSIRNYQKLLVSPGSMREKFIFLIKREIKNAGEGKKAEIIAKMNSLVDPEIIKLLYLASDSGVKISLIIRGICCLYPQRKNLSENIKVISIIGHFLEHSRIFWFCNNGDNEVFIGSADWMRRNLDRRIEAVTPIEDYELKSKIYTLLQTYIKDNYFSWIMKDDGSYSKYELDSSHNRSQIDLIEK